MLRQPKARRHRECSDRAVASRAACFAAAISLLVAAVTVRDDDRQPTTPPRVRQPDRWRTVFRAAIRIRRHRHMPDLSHGPGRFDEGHGAPAGEEPTHAGGDARLRELPRAGSGACGRRGEGPHQEVQADEARRGEQHVPDVPQPRRPRRVGRQRTRAANLTCTTCHSVHAPKSFESQLVKATQTELCARCHRVQVVKTERAVAHMPVREGKMSCASCHNPHGSITNVKALRTGSSVAESCISCHTEMRGPILWEHAPVRESCATCHDPHGSSNDRMLNVMRMPDALSALPRRHAPPVVHLRLERDQREQEQPDVRPFLRELPLQRPRIEPSVRTVLHAIGGLTCARFDSLS